MILSFIVGIVIAVISNGALQDWMSRCNFCNGVGAIVPGGAYDEPRGDTPVGWGKTSMARAQGMAVRPEAGNGELARRTRCCKERPVMDGRPAVKAALRPEPSSMGCPGNSARMGYIPIDTCGPGGKQMFRSGGHADCAVQLDADTKESPSMNGILLSLFRYKAWANVEMHAVLAKFNARQHPDQFCAMLRTLDHVNYARGTCAWVGSSPQRGAIPRRRQQMWLKMTLSLCNGMTALRWRGTTKNPSSLEACGFGCFVRLCLA